MFYKTTLKQKIILKQAEKKIWKTFNFLWEKEERIIIVKRQASTLARLLLFFVRFFWTTNKKQPSFFVHNTTNLNLEIKCSSRRCRRWFVFLNILLSRIFFQLKKKKIYKNKMWCKQIIVNIFFLMKESNGRIAINREKASSFNRELNF